jgi:hypothetical protein
MRAISLIIQLVIDWPVVPRELLMKPATPSPKQTERRERIRARGRKHYIFYTGVLGWGLSVVTLTTLWDWYGKYGWHIPPRGDLYYESGYLVFRLAIWLTGGYFFGAAMWERMGFKDSTGVASKP